MKEKHQESNSPKPKRPKFVLWVVLFAAIGFGVQKGWYYHTHEVTDDAQVEGRVLPILPKVGGFVEKVLVQDNQFVHQGDTLVVLDQREILAKIAQAHAEVLAAQAAAHGGIATASVVLAGSQQAVANANVELSKANFSKAQKELARVQELRSKDLASQAQLDQAQAALETSKAALHASEEQQKGAHSGTQGAQAQLRQADARLASAQANLDYLKLQLDYSVVKSPCDGRVSKKSVELGQLLNPGQPLMSIVAEDQPWIIGNFKETQISALKPGMDVDVEIDAYDGVKFRGKIQSIQSATGARFALLPPDNATGNFTKVVQRVPVRIELVELDPKLRLLPGMSVNLAIPLR